MRRLLRQRSKGRGEAQREEADDHGGSLSGFVDELRGRGSGARRGDEHEQRAALRERMARRRMLPGQGWNVRRLGGAGRDRIRQHALPCCDVHEEGSDRAGPQAAPAGRLKKSRTDRGSNERIDSFFAGDPSLACSFLRSVAPIEQTRLRFATIRRGSERQLVIRVRIRIFKILIILCRKYIITWLVATKHFSVRCSNLLYTVKREHSKQFWPPARPPARVSAC